MSENTTTTVDKAPAVKADAVQTPVAEQPTAQPTAQPSAEDVVRSLFPQHARMEKKQDPAPEVPKADAPKADAPQADAPAATPADAPKTEAEKPAEAPKAEDGKEPTWAERLLGVAPQVAVTPEAKEWVKAVFGEEDPEAFVSKVRATTDQVAKMEKTVQEATEYQKALSSLPVQMQNAITKHLNGEDGLAELRSTPAFDFSKEAKRQDKEALIGHYFPGKVTKDTFEAAKEEGDETAQERIDMYFDLASSKYEADRAKVNGYLSEQKAAREAFTKAQAASVNASIDHLKATRPEMAALVTPDLKEALESGQKINEFLYNPDGTYRKDLVSRILAAEHFDEMLSQARALLTKQVRVEAEQDVLNRLPEGARQSGKAEGKPVEQAKENPTQDAINFLMNKR